MKISKMKILSLLLGLIVLISSYSPAIAQTAITQKAATDYYNSCLTKTDERITSQTQDIFCRCTATYMMKNMSVEEVQYMAGQNQNARNSINKMLTTVYAPCMEFPVRDWVFQKCTNDAYQAGQKICSCMSNNMATYVRERAAADLPAILAANPNVTDPMAAIVSSPTYEQAEKRIVLGCVQGEFN